MPPVELTSEDVAKLTNATPAGATQWQDPLPNVSTVHTGPRNPALERISKRENREGNPNIGYGGADLTAAPLDKNGFPIWAGKMGPQGMSHAAGLYQIQPGTWGPIAQDLGIRDFSPESQHRVAEELFKREGAAPWKASETRADAVTTRRTADNKYELNPDDVAVLTEKTPAAGTPESNQAALIESPKSQSWMEALGTGLTAESNEIAFRSEHAAVANGIRKGVMDVPLGLAQAVLPRSVMEPVEEQVRNLNAQFAGLEDEHPNYDFAGRMVGSTLAIAGAGGLLGAAGVGAYMPRAATAVWDWIGLPGRAAAVGAASGATLYYPEGPERESRPLGVNPRAFDGVIGGLFGSTLGVIGRGVQWAATNVSRIATTARMADASQKLYQQGEQLAARFNAVLTETAGGIARNSEQPLRDTLAHYRRVEQTASSRYSLRNEVGREFEGFPAGVGAEEVGAEPGFAQAIDTALQTSRRAGVETRRTVEATASRVESILGLDAERARLREWQAAQRLYERDLERARAERAKLAYNPPPRPGQDPAELQANANAYYRGLEARGQLTPLPEPPPAFVPRPVTADAYAQARTALNAATRRTRDAAARTQLGALMREIDGVAASTAAEHGMEAAEFARLAETANAYYSKNVAPLRQFFGGKTAREVEGRAGQPLEGLTPAQFYDRVAKVINGDDLVMVRDLGKALGPRGLDNMKMIAAAEGILKGDGKAWQYVKTHEDTLRELFGRTDQGRSEFQQLTGLAKIAEHLAEMKPAESGPKGIKDMKQMLRWGHSVGPAFGFYQLGHAMVAAATGGPAARHVMEAAVMFAAVPLSHFTFNVVNRIHMVPLVRPLVRRAAQTTPGSAEMDELITQIERRVRTATAAGAKTPGP